MTTVMYDDRNVLRLRLHFCSSCVQRIKERIPVRHRTWDSQAGAWFISMTCLDTLISILRACESINDTALIDVRLWRNN